MTGATLAVMLRSTTSLLALTLTSAALIACGDDSTSSGSGGAGGDDPGSTTTGTTTTTSTGTGTGTSTGTSGGGGGGTAVACEDAVDGDPCATPGESCGAIECYGCSSFCADGEWNVNCTEEPACDSDPVAWGTVCDSFCGPFDCGPYDVEAACGVESLGAECGPFGWAYTGSECFPDCRAAGDAESCGALLDCVWLVPCEGSDDMTPRCASLGAAPAAGGVVQQFCDDQPCPMDQVCVELGVNPSDLASGDCSGSGSLATVCDPQLPPK